MNILFHLFDDILAVWTFLYQHLRHFIRLYTRKKQRERNNPRQEQIQFDDIWIVREDYRYFSVNENKMQFFEMQFQDKAKNPWISLLQAADAVYVSINFVPVALDEAMKEYKHKMSALQEEKIVALNSGITSVYFIESQIRKVEREMEAMMGKTHAHEIRCFLGLPYPYDKKHLDVFATMHNINFFPLYFRQIEAFRYFFFHPPILSQNVRPVSFHALNPFTIAGTQAISGIYIGHTVISHIPVFEDFFSNENFNSVIIAKSGAGKSFLTKLLIKRLLFTGVSVIVCDPEGEYTDISESFSGLYYEENDVNKIDTYMHNDDMYLKNMLPLLCNDEEVQRVQFLLQEKKTLQECIEALSHAPIAIQQKVLPHIFLQTVPIADNALHIFHISSQDIKVAVYKIMYYAMHRPQQKTIIFIDEAHRVMDDPYIAQLVRQLAKRGRKYQIGICVISQDILDFVQNKWSKAVISNASCKFLLKQEPINLPLIHSVFGIDESYDEFLKNAQIGEGIFMKNNQIQQMKFDDV